MKRSSRRKLRALLEKRIALSTIVYRSDIDGLRALAVIPVMLYHAEVPYISGGYTGVDIFFVISGFLITLSLLADENFPPAERIARFYERRIRRIIPALALMVGVTLFVGTSLLLPSELIQLGQSAAATALFTSNFWFWSQTGYFAAAAESMPLLHTWSLAVEEQFYVVFPLLIIAIGRGRRAAVLAAVSLAAIGSFAASAYLTQHSPSVAFYWPISRVWELFLGAALALTESWPRRMREAVSLTGLATIIVSFFAFNSKTPFPGYAALAPSLGAAAVIYGGRQTLTARILSFQPFVWTGLISYSLYLWHWPILVFTKLATVTEDVSTLRTAGCFAATVMAAALSWRYVETPFRKRHMPRIRVFRAAGAALSCGIAAGLALIALQGLPSRFSEESLALAESQVAEGPNGNCIKYSRFLCQAGPGRPEFLLWGDSHAGALAPAISNVADTPGLYAVFNGCPPLAGFVPEGLRGDDRPNCQAHNHDVLEIARSDRNIRVVILAGRWSAYSFSGQHLRVVLDALAGKHVVIIGDNPAPGINIPRILALNGTIAQIQPTKEPESFRVLRDYPNIELVRLSEALCTGDICPATHGLHPLYGDGNHISSYAANTTVTSFLKDRLSGIMEIRRPL